MNLPLNTCFKVDNIAGFVQPSELKDVAIGVIIDYKL